MYTKHNSNNIDCSYTFDWPMILFIGQIKTMIIFNNKSIKRRPVSVYI